MTPYIFPGIKYYDKKKAVTAVKRQRALESDDKGIAENIILDVCEALDLDFLKVASKSRLTENVMARCLSMYLIKQKTRLSLKSIGSFYSNRDHSTVIYNLDLFKELIDSKDKILSNAVKLYEHHTGQKVILPSSV